ncbi:MAG: cobalamin-dependent protein [Candidatus Bathyarchaeota archaeon]|nr:MAG: cobalamin-dependent protein [Candidatus Bathyarchaeota archaeon]
MRVVFVEPPKDFWFVMGEYLPPPTASLQLAAYLESKRPQDEITVIDCQAERLDWDDMEKRIEAENPHVVAVSSLATCNTYLVARALEAAKKVAPDALTITGGQHFTALAEPSLREYPILDAVARGEGEETLVGVVEALEADKGLANVRGLAFRHGDEIVSTPPRHLIQDLDALPMPGYHFVEDHLDRYHFKMMAGDMRYAIIEGSRGCEHNCIFCSQCVFWGNRWRAKSGKRIAEEMEYCRERFGAEFLWLTDDNFAFGPRADELFRELNAKGLGDELLWFVQARVDDVVNNGGSIGEMRKSGNQWVLLGVESGDTETLADWRKGIKPGQTHEAIRQLKENDIFAQATLIIGNRKDTHESIEGLRRFVEDVDPDLAIYMILTPFPGTPLYEEAAKKGWIEDWNWANYDMIHAVMPTETLSTQELQEELYLCYRSFYGRLSRQLRGVFSSNKFKRRTYRYMASQRLLRQLRGLV